MTGILIVDDRHADCERVVERLTDRGYRVSAIADAAATCASVRSLAPEMVLLNALSSRFDCLQVLVRIKRRYPRLPVIAYCLTGPGAVDRLLEAVDGLREDIHASKRPRQTGAGLKFSQFANRRPQASAEGILRPACFASAPGTESES